MAEERAERRDRGARSSRRRGLRAQLRQVPLELLVSSRAREPAPRQPREVLEVAAVGVDRPRRAAAPRAGRGSASSSGSGMRAGRRPGAGAWRRRGCRPAWSRASCARAAPGSCAGRRRPRAGGSRTRGGAGAGAGEPPQRARVEPAAARREEERVLGARARAPAARRAGSARASTRPPRRAARRAPCRPCRARARAPARSRRRRGRGDRLARCAGRPSRRARRARGCAARAGRRPRARRASTSISFVFGASGSRRARRGASDRLGHARRRRARERRNERTAASLRAIVAGASLRGGRVRAPRRTRRARARRRRRARRRACRAIRERRQVEAVRAARGLGEGRAKRGSARRHPRLDVRRLGTIASRGGQDRAPRPSRQGGRGYGANVQPGQVVDVNASTASTSWRARSPAHAYRRGARFVDVGYFDPYVKRARIEHADEDTLDFVPPWYGKRALDRRRAARLAIRSQDRLVPGLLDDLDAARVGRDLLPRIKESFEVINERVDELAHRARSGRGLGAPGLPGLDEDPLGKLWDRGRARLPARHGRPGRRVARAVRPDRGRRPSPDRAPLRRACTSRGRDRPDDRAAADLAVGATRTTRRSTASTTSRTSRPEEVSTTPDPQRADGVVTLDAPARAERRDADRRAPRALRGRPRGRDRRRSAAATRSAGARRSTRARSASARSRSSTGEGRIGPLGTVFYDTLLDENAASHLALGGAYEFAVGAEDIDKSTARASALRLHDRHDEVGVTGITRDGERVPILRSGSWQV